MVDRQVSAYAGNTTTHQNTLSLLAFGGLSSHGGGDGRVDALHVSLVGHEEWGKAHLSILEDSSGWGKSVLSGVDGTGLGGSHTDNWGLVVLKERWDGVNACRRLLNESWIRAGLEGQLTLGVDGARNAVGDTDVKLGEGVFGVDGSVGHVTDSGGLDHVLDRVSLDGLVLEG